MEQVYKEDVSSQTVAAEISGDRGLSRQDGPIREPELMGRNEIGTESELWFLGSRGHGHGEEVSKQNSNQVSQVKGTEWEER